jgi:hypothetical protein
MDEMDPLLTALEHARDVAQQKYLRSLEDSIINVEFAAFLTTLRDEQSTMFEVDENRPRRAPWGHIDEGSTDSPLTARRRERRAFQRFVQNVKERDEAASSRAAAAQLQHDRAINITPDDHWRTGSLGHQNVITVRDTDHVRSKQSPRDLMDLPTWLGRRQGQVFEFQGLGHSVISSYAASRYWKRQAQSGIAAEDHKLTRYHQQRSTARVLSDVRQKEGDSDHFMVFNATGVRQSSGQRMCGGSSKEHFFIIDTGTNVSLVPDKDILEGIDPSSKIKIKGFNSSVSNSQGQGTIFGFSRSSNGLRTVPLRFPNVHYLPGAPHDLLSVSALAQLGYKFHFDLERSFIVTPEGDELDLLQRAGLYWLRWRRALNPSESKPLHSPRNNFIFPHQQHLQRPHCAQNGGRQPTSTKEFSWRPHQREDFDDDFLSSSEDYPAAAIAVSFPSCTSKKCASCNTTLQAGATKVPLMLLHRRLAHWNEDLLQKMVKHRAVDMVLSDRARCVCDVCRVSKATRRHVADHREHLAEQTRPFQRVWTDLKGKVCRDFFGNQHLVTFTCEVSRWTCIYFAKLKSDVKNRYREFLKWVELQGYKVEQLNSDGGGEYTANENAKVISEFQQISLENGITQNFTAAYTPEMNGISERLNRTIVEHTRALLLEAGLAREFWSLAAKHVVFIRNRLWHRHLQNSINVGASPFQIVYGKAPRLGTLRVWGCDAWKLDHLHQSSSFSRKAKKMIFVGISPNRKGWVLFDPSTRKTTTTYHCTFDEDMANRRCALRDFDLRQHKAGPGATADEHRLAQLERSLYNDDAIIDFDDSVHDSKGHKGHKHHGAEEAYTGPSTPASPHPQDDRSDDSVQKQPIHSQQPPQPEPRPDRQIGGRRDGGFLSGEQRLELHKT